MPIVNVHNIGKVNFPDEMSHEDIVNAIETEVIPSYEAHVEKTGPISAISGAFKKSMASANEGIAQPLEEFGFPEAAAGRRKAAEEYKNEAAQTYEGVSEEEVAAAQKQGVIPGALKWGEKEIVEPIAGIIGRYGPQTAASLATGALAPEAALGVGAARALGFIGTDIAPEMGENIEAAREAGTEEPSLIANVSGGLVEAAIGHYGLPLTGKLAGTLFKKAEELAPRILSGELSKEAAVKELGGFGINIAKEVGANAVSNAAAMTGIEATRRAVTGQELTSPEALEQYGEGAKTAAMLSPIFGGVHGVMNVRGARGALPEGRAEEVPVEPTAQTQPAMDENSGTININGQKTTYTKTGERDDGEPLYTVDVPMPDSTVLKQDNLTMADIAEMSKAEPQAQAEGQPTGRPAFASDPAEHGDVTDSEVAQYITSVQEGSFDPVNDPTDAYMHEVMKMQKPEVIEYANSTVSPEPTRRRPVSDEDFDALRDEEALEENVASEGVDKQQPSVATSDINTGHTAESLQPHFTPEMKRLVESGKLTLHDTRDTLPGEDHPENVQGLTTPQGEVHLVASKLTPETLPRVAMHEMGVHVGMRGMVGDKVWGDLTSQALTTKGEAFDRARKSVPENTPEHLKGEETLAYLVENAPHLPIVKRAVSAIKNWARTTFGARLSITESDIHHLAAKALRKESQTSKRSTREGTAYAQKPRENSRIGMPHEQILKRVPELTESAKKMMDMLYDNGMLVRGTKGNLVEGVSNKDVEDFARSNPEFRKLAEAHDALVEKYKPVEPYQSLPTPATEAEMQGALKDKQAVYINRPVPDGYKVKLRLDIPAYKRFGTWVVTAHEGNTKKNSIFGVDTATPLAYYGHAVADNPKFSIEEANALKIADTTRDKYPLATVDGEYVNMSAKEAKRLADEAMTDPDWVQVGMDPERHSYFYDRKTMQPIKSGSRVIQIGSILMVKDPVYGKKSEYVYSVAKKDKLLAPNGKPSNLNEVQHKQVRSPAFKEWFGDWEKDPKNASKVVDENGEPLVVYHGSKKDITKFEKQRMGMGSSLFGDYEVERHGIFTTPDKKLAEEFALQGHHNFGANITPLFVSSKNILDMLDGSYSDELFEKVIKYAESKGLRGYATARKLGDFWSGETWKMFDADDPFMPPSDWIQMFKELGFDGIKMFEPETEGGVSGESFVSFKPNQIKSAIGNTGEFSKTNNDIRYSTHKDPLINDVFKESNRTTKVDSDPTLHESIAKAVKRYTPTRISWIDPTDKIGYLLRSLDTFDVLSKKLRADRLIQQIKQLGQVIRAVEELGVPVLKGDGTVGVKTDMRLALSEIHNRAVELGKKHKFDGPQLIDEVARTMLGKETRAEDAKLRAYGQHLKSLADTHKQTAKHMAAQGNYSVSEINKELRTADQLNKKAKEYLSIDREKVVTPAHITRIEAVMKKYPETKVILDDIRDLLRSHVELAHATGLIDAHTARKWNSKKDYIPMYKPEDLESFENEGSSWGIGMGSKTIKNAADYRREGHLHKINVWDNLQKHTALMVASSAQNEMRRTAVSQLSRFGEVVKAKDQGRTSVDGNLALYENGVKTWYIVKDPDALVAFQNFNYGAKPLMQMAGKMLRVGALYNPIYWYRQLVRDPLAANLVANVGGVVTPFHTMAHIAHILSGRSTNFRTLREHGVVGPVDLTHNYNSMQDQIGKAMSYDKNIWSTIKNQLIRVHEASDSATRVALYNNALKDAKKLGLSGQDAENYATHRARDSINFAVHGTSEALHTIRVSTPFFSSTLNGLDTVYRAAKQHNLSPRESKELRNRFYSRALMMSTMTAMYTILLQDDEAYKDMPASEKDGNWLVPIGKDKNGKTIFFKVPAPFEVGFLFKTLPELIINRLNSDATNKEIFKSVKDGLIANALPPMPLVPQLLKPLVETITNYDLHNMRPIESANELNKMVESRGEGENAFYDWLSKDLKLKEIYLSPKKVQHLWQGYFAQLGAVTASLADSLITSAKGEGKTPVNPESGLLKGILTDPTKSKYKTEFYDMANDAAKIVNSLNSYDSTGQGEKVKEMVAKPETKRALQVHDMSSKAELDIADIREAINTLKHRPDSPENREEIRNLKLTENKIAKSVVKASEKIK